MKVPRAAMFTLSRSREGLGEILLPASRRLHLRLPGLPPTALPLPKTWMEIRVLAAWAPRGARCRRFGQAKNRLHQRALHGLRLVLQLAQAINQLPRSCVNRRAVL